MKTLQEQIDEKKDWLIELAFNLLEHAKCPDCDGSGGFEDEQCFWCYHKSKFETDYTDLSSLKKVRRNRKCQIATLRKEHSEASKYLKK